MTALIEKTKMDNSEAQGLISLLCWGALYRVHSSYVNDTPLCKICVNQIVIAVWRLGEEM